jgi:hypothetical protein
VSLFKLRERKKSRGRPKNYMSIKEITKSITSDRIEGRKSIHVTNSN